MACGAVLARTKESAVLPVMKAIASILAILSGVARLAGATSIDVITRAAVLACAGISAVFSPRVHAHLIASSARVARLAVTNSRHVVTGERMNAVAHLATIVSVAIWGTFLIAVFANVSVTAVAITVNGVTYTIYAGADTRAIQPIEPNRTT